MDTSKIVGEKIKSLRESQSISMEELSQRSGLAIEQIERIENNIDLPSSHQDSARAGGAVGHLP
jgi:transcriptional regulator with XRE-family HTH domain